MVEVFFLISKILTVIIGIFCLWLGFWVYFHNRKLKVNYFFLWMSIFLFLWIIACYVGNSIFITINPFWGKIAYGTVALFFIPFYFFSISFLNEEKKFPIVNLFLIFTSIFLFIFSVFGSFMVEKMNISEFGAVPDLGSGKYVYFVLILFWFLYIAYRFFVNYFRSSTKIKIKLYYFLIGFFIWVSMNLIFNVILPFFQNIPQYWFIGNYSAIFLLGFTAYAIVKQELMGIKTLLTQAIIVVISIILLADVLFLSDNPTMQLLKLGVLLAFLYFSREMVKSAKKEKESREELEKASQNLASTNQKLRNLLAMKNDFLHIVSHQLRTPLTAMRGFISMWDDGDFDAMPKDKMADIKNKVVNNAERLNNIVNDMVLAMESEGELKVNIQSVDLEKLLAGNIEMQKPSFEKKNLYLKCAKIAKNIPKIEADERLLLNVFMNLIDNAEKYTEKGGLTIAAVQDGKNVKIDFIDTGIGLSNEDKKILFKKFSRGAKSNYINPNGSGLGLFIIKQIVSLHRGKIKAESEGEGKGSIFTVTLPVKQGR